MMTETVSAFASAPTDSVTVRIVSPGYVRVAFPDAIPGVAAVGANAAKIIGAGSGRYIAQIGSSSAELVGYVGGTGAQPRFSGLSDVVLVPAPPTGSVNECYVEAEPQTRAAVERLLLSWFDPAQDWTVVPVLPADQYELDPLDPSTQTLTLIVGIAGALVVMLVAGTIQWARRQEFALYRILGYTRGQILALITAEWLALAAAPAAAGVTIGLGVYGALHISGVFLPFGIASLGFFAAGVAVTPPVVTLIVLSTKPTDALKGA